MGSFFKKQRYDYAGVLAVRLQKFLLFLFLLSLAYFGMHVHAMMRSGHFFAAPFVGANLSWLVLYTGFIGAYNRRTGFLLAYAIICLLSALALIVHFVLSSVYISLTVLHECQETQGCNPRSMALKDVSIITAVVFGFTIVPLVLKVIGAVLALVTRREILAERADAATVEEGFALTADNSDSDSDSSDCESDSEEPQSSAPTVYEMAYVQQQQYQQPIQLVHVPAVYAPAGQQAQYQPMGAYSQPAFYYYYPTQQ